MNANLRLISSLKETFDGDPWYGTSLMKKIKETDLNTVNKKPATSSNSIAMIIQHILNWRVFAIEKLKGNYEFDIQLNTKDDWEEIVIANEEEWLELLRKLQATQNELLRILKDIDDEVLSATTPGRTYNLGYLIEGIIQHDIYHLGQIAVIR